MKIKLLDIKHESAALHLTSKQKKELLELFNCENIKMVISRSSIQIKRLKQAYDVMSENRKHKFEMMLKNVKFRAGRSKCINLKYWIEITPDLCWLYGFLVGDGSMLRVCRFYNTNYFLVRRVKKIIKSHFGINIKKEPNRTIDFYVSKPVQIILEQIFGKKGKSVEAKVPKIFFDLPKEHVSSFITGIFDTDGTCSDIHVPSIMTPNLDLLLGLKSLLKQKFDISTRISKTGHNHIITLGLFDKVKTFFNVLKFYEKIGFSHPRKANLLKMKVEKRTIYKIFQLVKSGIKQSRRIHNILKIDRSTVVDHLNKLEKFGLIEKKTKLFGVNNNLRIYEWHPTN